MGASWHRFGFLLAGLWERIRGPWRPRWRFWELSSGLRPIPPPCLDCGSEPEASWMLIGVSWGTSGEPVGGSFEASWGLMGGPIGGLLELLLGLLRASWVLVGASWGPFDNLGPPLGAQGSKSQFDLNLGPVSGRSWGSLGPSWASWPSWEHRPARPRSRSADKPIRGRECRSADQPISRSAAEQPISR